MKLIPLKRVPRVVKTDLDYSALNKVIGEEIEVEKSRSGKGYDTLKIQRSYVIPIIEDIVGGRIKNKSLFIHRAEKYCDNILDVDIEDNQVIITFKFN